MTVMHLYIKYSSLYRTLDNSFLAAVSDCLLLQISYTCHSKGVVAQETTKYLTHLHISSTICPETLSYLIIDHKILQACSFL